MRRLRHSFRHAFRGIRYVFANEQNFRIQMMVALAAIVLAVIFAISRFEWLLLLLIIGLVLLLELVNTAVETMLDLLKPRLHVHVERAKDTMAAAVLVASLVGLIIGLFIFVPRIVELLGQ